MRSGSSCSREWLLTFEMFQSQLAGFEAQFRDLGPRRHPGEGPYAHSLQAGDHRLGPMALFNLPMFVVASIATRGLRFVLVAWLFKKFGPTLAPIIEKRIGLFSMIFLAILIGGFVVAPMMH
jgi:hypothetical protein